MGTMEQPEITPLKKVVWLSQRREERQNPEEKQIEDMDRLELIYLEIQKIHNDDARRLATLACRSSQVFVSKSVLD